MLFTFTQFDAVCKRNRQPNERLAISKLNHVCRMNESSNTISTPKQKVKRPWNFTDLVGYKFSRMTVIEYSLSHRWVCRCECGKIKEVNAGALNTGRVKSCGCLNLERVRKHGHSAGGKRSKTYKVWDGMKARCYNPRAAFYDLYGGRGIKACDRWLHSFENFLADMGERPVGKTLDRINSDGDYEPSNCRWATPFEQQNNRSNNKWIEYGGRRMTYAQWGREIGLPKNCISDRVRLGWSVEKIITTPYQINMSRKAVV